MNDTARLLREGKLDQVCPDCGRWEAAGSYCTGCSRPMGAEDWYPKGDLAARQARKDSAGKMVSPAVKRGRGRPRRVMAPDTLGLVS